MPAAVLVGEFPPTNEAFEKLLEQHGWVELQITPGYLVGDPTDLEDRRRLRGLLIAIAVGAVLWAAIIFGIAAVIR